MHEELGARFEGREKELSAAFRSLTKSEVRSRVLREQVRIDGRGPRDIRPLSAEVGVLPRVHGSALFERGETQILGVTTLNMLRMEQALDTLSPEKSKRYMHNYNFPPYSTGETGRVGSPKRREIGHGALAERALIPVLPSREEFPYAIRQVSEALGSNGSTSMGSVCASTLGLLSAGVPLKAPVAGIAMGLISDEVDGKTQYVTLTDILGAEDAFGDMDFKVAGTRDFVTALQLDTKLDGIPSDVLAAALQQAHEARQTILDVMQRAIEAPAEMSDYAPRVTTVKIPVDKIGMVIGPKGQTINAIQDETGAEISIEDDGTIYVGATNGPSAQAAVERINAIANPTLPKMGDRFLGTVVKTAPFGAFVSLLPGRDGLLHISKVGDGKRVEKVEDFLNVGDRVEVEIADIDQRGKIYLDKVRPEGAERRPPQLVRSGPPAATGVVTGVRVTGVTASAVATGSWPRAWRRWRGRRRQPSATPYPAQLTREPLTGRATPSPAGSFVNSSIPSSYWKQVAVSRTRHSSFLGTRPGSTPRAGRQATPTARAAGGSTRAVTRTLSDDPLGGTVRRTVLPNGLRVLTEAIPAMRSVSFGIWVAVGSRDETGPQAGAAHFLEHLLFKGTHKRNALEISSAIEAVGGETNAFTTKEYTCYYARVLDEDLPLAIDVMCDLVADSLLEPADVETERGVILEEIAMHDDEPGDEVHDLFAQAVYGDHPLGRLISGTAETVTPMTRRQIQSFYRRATSRRRSSSPPPQPRPHRRGAAGPPGAAGTPLDTDPARPAATGHPRRTHPGRRHGGGGEGDRAGAHRAGLPGHRPARRTPLRSRGAEQRARRRHVQPAVPGDPGAPRPRLLRLLLRQPVRRQRPVRRLRRLRPGSGRRGAGADPGRVGAYRRARRHRGGTGPGQGDEQGFVRARPGGHRFPDEPAGQGRAALRGPGAGQRAARPGRRGHPRRRQRPRRRTAGPADVPRRRRPVRRSGLQRLTLPVERVGTTLGVSASRLG